MSAIPTTERTVPVSDSPDRLHPCFSAGHAKSAARVHLPVAPRCNVQCQFCDRAFDCVNESRPGVTASLLSPEEALQRVDLLRERLPQLSVVGIAGPGDPLANPRETLATLRLVKDHHPDLTLCLSTNGLALPAYVKDLVDVGVSHLTVTMNALDPEVISKIYAWVRVENRAKTGVEAAEILLARQRAGLAEAVARGLTVKINTILIPGVNEDSVEPIAVEAAALGVQFMNMIPLLPVKGTAFGGLGEPSKETVRELRSKAESHLPQLSHCARCRADAAGLLGKDVDLSTLGASRAQGGCASSSCGGLTLSVPKKKKAFRVAAATREGLLVNRHLGEVEKLFVFSVAEDGSFDTLDIRPLPPEGGGADRWEGVAATLSDCEALLVAGIGAPPRRILEDKGLRVHEVEGLIAEALTALWEGKDLSFLSRRSPSAGSSCSGGASRGCGCA